MRTLKSELFKMAIYELFFIIIYSITKINAFLFLYMIAILFVEIKNLLKKNFESIICQSFMLIPLIGILKIGSIPLINMYIILFVMYNVFFNKKNGISKKYFIALCIYICLDFTKVIISSFNYFSIGLIVSSVTFYTSLYMMLYLVSNKNKFNKFNFIISFICGTTFSIIYGFITRLISGGLSFALINSSIITRNFGASGDPNYFGMYICLTISFLYILFNTHKKHRVSYYLLILFYMFMGLSSSSRMYYVLLAVLLICYFIFIIKDFFSKKMLSVISFLLCLIVLLYFSGITKYIVNNIEYLLIRLGDSDLSNGRFTLLNNYISFMTESDLRFLFGIGIPNYNIRSGLIYCCHNLYMELFVTNGLILSCMFVFSFIYYFIKKVQYNAFYNFIPLGIVLISGFGVNFIDVDCFYLIYGLLFILLDKNIVKEV